MNFASAIPTWLWVVAGFIAFVAIAGDRIIWKYEAHFPLKAGSGRGKIKLACGKKKGVRIRYYFELEEQHRGRKLDILVDNKLIHSIPAEQTAGAKLFKFEKISMDKPEEGAEVEVYSERDNKLFESVLVLD